MREKIDPILLEGLDLSSWRLAANGAEKLTNIKSYTLSAGRITCKMIDENNIEIPEDFVTSPYTEPDKAVLDKYRIDNWVERVFEL